MYIYIYIYQIRWQVRYIFLLNLIIIVIIKKIVQLMGTTRPNLIYVGWVEPLWWVELGWIFFNSPWWIRSKNPLNPTHAHPWLTLVHPHVALAHPPPTKNGAFKIDIQIHGNITERSNLNLTHQSSLYIKIRAWLRYSTYVLFLKFPS